MAEAGDLGFCGNPFNHPAHNIEGTDGYCAGVGRQEVKDVIVEKYEPEKVETMAEDGTEYSKVTILIEDKKGVTIIHAPKASFPYASAKTEEHIPLDRNSKHFYPTIDKVDFTFRPHENEEGAPVSIERKVNGG